MDIMLSKFYKLFHDMTSCNKKTSDALFSHGKKPWGNSSKTASDCDDQSGIDPCHPPVSEASHDAFVQLVQHLPRSLAYNVGKG